MQVTIIAQSKNGLERDITGRVDARVIQHVRAAGGDVLFRTSNDPIDTIIKDEATLNAMYRIVNDQAAMDEMADQIRIEEEIEMELGQ